MTTLALRLSGWLLAHTPEPVLQVAARFLGTLLFALARGRRRLVLSNLSHAFPEKNPAWRRKIGRQSCCQLAETAMMSLAAPFFSKERIRRCAGLSESFQDFVRTLEERPRPVVLGTVHLAQWEAQTWLPVLVESKLPTFGIIYRPLDNAQTDAFVKKTREIHGFRLLSRKSGLVEAMRILQKKGCVGVLFDQNAGQNGALSLFLGRVCSTTELPGTLAERCGAEVRIVFLARTGFWRIRFECIGVEHDGSAAGVTVALNRKFEHLLQTDETLCSSWLWAHNRWRNQDVPERRFRLEARRSLLEADLRARGLSQFPKKTRLWVRMPNWLGDGVMALPLLRALRKGRPDAEITLVARSAFIPLLESWSVADRFEALPARGPGYFLRFLKPRSIYPDTWIVFTNSFRGDLEAWIAGSPQRFGIRRVDHPRPLLTHTYAPGSSFDETGVHQCKLWESFLNHFGLQERPDYAPLHPTGPRPDGPIGLIPGSENSPEKRWPVRHWRALIESLPNDSFVLFGVKGDQPICSDIAAGFEPARVRNLAGQTTLTDYAQRLLGCRLLVANDTGGLHLANALGVPVLGLFGPSNPVRTGPVFTAPFRILQAPGSHPRGGGDLDLLEPESVLSTMADFGGQRLPPVAKTT